MDALVANAPRPRVRVALASLKPWSGTWDRHSPTRLASSSARTMAKKDRDETPEERAARKAQGTSSSSRIARVPLAWCTFLRRNDDARSRSRLSMRRVVVFAHRAVTRAERIASVRDTAARMRRARVCVCVCVCARAKTERD